MNLSMAIFCAAIPGIAFLYSILAWWVSRTRLPWLIQCLIVIAATLPLLLVEAGDVTLVFLVSSLVTVTISHSLQRHRLRSAQLKETKTQEFRWPTIDLKNLMSGVILFCVVTALVARIFEHHPTMEGSYPATHPARLVGIGVAIGLWSSSMFFLFFSKPIRRRSVILFLLAMALSLFWAGWNDTTVVPKIVELWRWMQPSTLAVLMSPPATSQMSVTWGWLVFLVVNSCLVTFVAWAFGTASNAHGDGKERTNENGFSSPRGQKNKATKFRMAFKVASVLAASLIATVMIASLSYHYVAILPSGTKIKPHRTYQPGKPNGIIELWEAGSEIGASSILNNTGSVLPGPMLQSEISSYSETFKKIDSGLAKPNCTWIDWSTGEVFSEDGSSFNSFEYLRGVELRSVARGLSSRSLQAHADGRFDDVLADGIRCIRVGEAASVDANLISALIGTAIEGIAVAMMQPAIKHAGETQLLASAAALDELMANSDIVDEEMERILKNEQAYLWLHGGWKDRLAMSLIDSENSIEGVHQAIIRRDVVRSLLRTAIAVELYRHDFDQYPDKLDTLIPDYLPQMPIDLFDLASKKPPLRYRVSQDGSSYQLYSVGINGLDENGTVVENYYREGDFDLDLIFGDRLKINQKDVEEYQRWNSPEEEMDDDFFDDDDFEFGDEDMEEFENSGADE